MTVRIADGRFVITRSGGGTIFNTDDKLFHVTNTLQGTQTIPMFSGGSGFGGFKNETTYYDLGAVNKFATQVIGAVKFVLTGPGAALWFGSWTALQRPQGRAATPTAILGSSLPITLRLTPAALAWCDAQ